MPCGSIGPAARDQPAFSHHNRHPGDDVILRVRPGALKAAGARPGDLLVASEGGALTDAISCSASGCKIKYVADGPTEAHVEGHIAFAASP